MLNDSIHAVTVCVGYGDFLAETAPWNVQHFNRWTVVTTPDDNETRHICRKYGIHCLVTNDCGRDGTFSKGRMIERGLQHVHANGWVMHIDADVALRTSFRKSLYFANIETKNIYGADRLMIRSYHEWSKLKHSGWMSGVAAEYPHGVSFPRDCQIGARWAGNDGYVPIGFFQLWHRGGGEEEWYGHRAKPYPVTHGSACRTDVQFALQWDRRNRVLLPETLVAHLESQSCKTGANWKGRTTKPFKATP